MLYCLLPAPAIQHIAYTEPFFAFFAFLAMLACTRRKTILATVSFTLATAFRANGILNAGFLWWTVVWKYPAARDHSLVSP